MFNDDAISQYICAECEQDIGRFNDKITAYKTVETQWMSKTRNDNPTHPYLKVLELVQVSLVQFYFRITHKHCFYMQECTNKVQSLLRASKLNEDQVEEFVNLNNHIDGSDTVVGSISILKNMLLDRHIYKVKTLQQICIDYFNTNGPDLLETVLKVPEPLGSCGDDSETGHLFDEDSQSQDVSVGKSDDSVLHKKKRRPNPVRHYINSRRRRNLKKHPRPRPAQQASALPKAIKSVKTVVRKPEPSEVTAVKLATVDRDESPDSITADSAVKATRFSERRSRTIAKLPSVSPANANVVAPSTLSTSASATADVPKRSRSSATTKSNVVLTDVTPPSADLIGTTERRSRTSLRKLASNTSPPIPAATKKSAPLRAILPRLPPTADVHKKEPPNKEAVKATPDTIIDRKLPASDKKPAVANRNLAVPDRKPVVSDKKPLILDRKATIPDRKSAVPDRKPAVSDTKPTLQDVKAAPAFPFKMPEKRKFRTHRDYIRNVSKKKRTSKMRINYSEALVDEALMYEEILMDKEAKEQLVMSTTLESSKKEAKKEAAAASAASAMALQLPKKMSLNAVEQWKADAVASSDICISKVCKSTAKPSVRPLPQPQPSNTISSEISITPIRKPGPARSSQSVQPLNVSLSEIKKTFRSNPDVVFNYNSSVSIQLKTVSSTPPAAKCETSSEISLNDGPIKCKYCDRMCGNMNHLAVHQTTHMRLETHKIGESQVLAPKWRRGRMVPMGNQKCFRCLNCWRLHPDSQSILEHWVSGKCLHYCSICGLSFHHNPKLIRSHFPEVHGIRYKLPEENDSHALAKMNVAPGGGVVAGGGQSMKIFRPIRPGGRMISTMSKAKPIVSKSGRVTCHICSCSFPNMHSRNSHMRLHKPQSSGMAVPSASKSVATVVNGPASSPAPANASTPPATVRMPPTQIRNGMRYNRLSINNPDAKHPAFQFRSPPGPKTQSQQIAQGQLQQLLQQQPKPFTHSGGNAAIRNRQLQHQQQNQQRQHQQRQQQQRQRKPAVTNERRTQEVAHFASNIKAEIDIDEQDYSEYNSVDYSADGMVEYTNVMPMQPEVVMSSSSLVAKLPELTIKSEPVASSSGGGGLPRIQIKKLIELQEPTYTSTSSAPVVASSAYYVASQTTSPPVVITSQQQLQMTATSQMPAYHLAPAQTGQIMQVSSQQIQVQQQQQQHVIQQPQELPQFQISQVQQLQNTQYYNPVFVVPQPQQSQEVYQYNDQYNDYNKYYS